MKFLEDKLKNIPQVAEPTSKSNARRGYDKNLVQRPFHVQIHIVTTINHMINKMSMIHLIHMQTDLNHMTHPDMAVSKIHMIILTHMIQIDEEVNHMIPNVLNKIVFFCSNDKV